MHHLQLKKKKKEEACNHHALPMFWYQTLQYESIESQIQIHLGPLLCPNLSKISHKRSWLTQETGQMRKTSDLGGGLLVICLFKQNLCVVSGPHFKHIKALESISIFFPQTDAQIHQPDCPLGMVELPVARLLPKSSLVKHSG